MPKIIENLRERILEEFGTLVWEVGYSTMTMQAVAKRCGVGVGTIYNYFSSKEELLMAYIAYSCPSHLQEVQALSRNAQCIDPVIRSIHDRLSEFNRMNEKLFAEEKSRESIHTVMLQTQGHINQPLSQMLAPFCGENTEPEMIVEAMLTWIRTGKSYEQVRSNIKKLL